MIDLDDPVALMLAAADALERAGVEAAAALGDEVADHDVRGRFSKIAGAKSLR